MYAQHEHWCWHACTYPWMTMLTCMYISMVEIFGSHNLASVINTYMWTMTCMCTLLCLLNAQFGKGRQCRRNTSIDIGDVLLTCMYLSVHATSLVKSGNVYAGKLTCIRRQTYMYTPASLHVYATSIDLMFNVLICKGCLLMASNAYILVHNLVKVDNWQCAHALLLWTHCLVARGYGLHAHVDFAIFPHKSLAFLDMHAWDWTSMSCYRRYMHVHIHRCSLALSCPWWMLFYMDMDVLENSFTLTCRGCLLMACTYLKRL